MSLKQTIDVLNRMEADGVIGRYCKSGAFAAFYYVEPMRKPWRRPRRTVRLKDGDVRTKMLKPEHIVATALRIGRPKDRVRVTEFLEGGAVDRDAPCPLLERHGLTQALEALCRAAGLANPCVIASKP